MKHWSADLLEFESLRAIVRRYIDSPQGRANLDSLAPVTDRAQLAAWGADLREALAFLGEGEEPVRFSDVPEIGPALAKLRIEGASLDPLELRDLILLIERTQDLRAALLKHPARFPRLAEQASAIEDLRPALRALAGKILPDGTLSDDASPELRRLRQQKLRQQKAIQDSLERFLRAHREDGVLQEDFVTIRNDRFVVPLVPSQKGKVPGVVHGSSASGQTVFVEPLATIEHQLFPPGRGLVDLGLDRPG
ncbi:MAG: endonuclease MutS2, partial [Bryobacteraceae bacterium]|nr:endonuclease MutS2 [Bryobacteraceae bacterium]